MTLAPADPKQPPDPPLSSSIQVELSCPKCGAPFLVEDEDVVSVTCGYCHSLLILSHPDRDEFYIADGTISDGEACLEICVESRVQAQRAEIASRLADPEGRPPAEFIIQNRMRAFEERLRQRAQLHAAHCIQVPYWHVTGTLVQHILGREQDIKQTRVRAFEAEQTLPGYDTARANLRDRGLRMARSHVRPLRLKDARDQPSFLPWVPIPERSYRDIDKWLRRQLDPKIQPMVQRGEVLFSQRILVYRPYWFAQVTLDGTARWMLLDGTFSTVGGYPTQYEVDSILGSCIKNPLEEDGPRELRIAATTSRCPDCGADVRFDTHAVVQICGNCQLGLAPAGETVQVTRYDHARPLERAGELHYVPFWRFEFRLTLPDGPTVTRLEDYAHALFPLGVPPRFRLSGQHLWVPATRLLGTIAGDATFKSLVELLHMTPPRAESGKVPVGGRAQFWNCSLPEHQAAELARSVLTGLHTKISAARLNGLVFRRFVLDGKLETSAPRLVFLPFTRQGQELRVGGARVPLLLLRGGAALEAQRLSVQAAARSRP